MVERRTGKTGRSGETKAVAPAIAGSAAQLLETMTARAAAEDVAAYDATALAAAGRLAWSALCRHKRGESVVAIDSAPELVRAGRPLSAITVVNDNMPFLFDSITGEVNDGAGEATLLVHPVLIVRHDRKGVAEILGDAPAGRQDAAADRVSLVHIHVPRLSDEQAADLSARLSTVLSQVRAAVADWRPMLARLDQGIAEMRSAPTQLPKPAVAEAIALLEWLRDDNFTFLGMRDYRYSGGEADGQLERADKPGLGILADPDVLVLRRGTEAVTTTPEIRAFLHGPEPIIVTKANTKSLVHRRIYLDYIGVKTFDAAGKVAGELRIVGLFTSTAYTRSVMNIPYLRSKAQAVIAKSGFDAHDHSGKALINVLESYPRDELFQVGVPTLRKFAEAILALGERPRVRVLARTDQFDRFVSVLVFVPRDRYDSQAREAIGAYLKRVFDGRVSAFYPAFPEGSLARVHFIIGRSGGKTPKVAQDELERGVRDIVRTWEDALDEAAATSDASPGMMATAARFPESYRNSFDARTALVDAVELAKVSAERPIVVDFYPGEDAAARRPGLKIYHRGAAVALSRRVPLLENMGFRVISESTFEIPAPGAPDGAVIFLHDMEIEAADGGTLDLADGGALFEAIFLSVWNGEADSDGYNALGRTAGLAPAEIGVLRAYGRYLQQAGIPQSQDAIAATLNRYPDIARGLFDLFSARLDPKLAGDGAAETAAVERGLEKVPSLDDDTIVRRFLNLIEATLRTNHFAVRPDGVSLAIKLESRSVTGLPEPRPWREIFVYGGEVEGVHLRFGPVARGGLRWSDRAQDYRTEVLGLVKAQQVKNAVIVPVGAKGGFLPKQLPAGGSREAVFEAGRAAYVNFVSSLLSVTDNLIEGEVVHPADVRLHDGDDPYFVVAADKGTATFSDTANAISQRHDFWLDDAFASGGSAGYDHKKMGITARGAWEAVKRHVREIGRDGGAWDIQTQPFTAVGVGDMSGDVFGNGMLLSRQTRLIAAFDHRDIFIDPTPDAERSFAERERLFALPRSSWQDYDKSLLSEGGMIVPRSQKSVELSAAAQAAIGLDKRTATPAEIMRAILKAPADLLWFGGIGTYVRAEAETNADVGDRANDAIRITAREVRAAVIGEGANLGVTQRARIEFGLNGGRCNSDAIDNSGGVNSSDVEVNIKIALASAMRSGKLTRPNRDKLLASMTEEVAELVLANNYEQTLALSLAERRGVADLPHQMRLMASLEGRGLLNREVEFLPSSEQLAERLSRGQPLTRAELGVLLAYAKLTLFDDVIGSSLPDDEHLVKDLTGYFPDRMAKKYRDEILAHRLHREIVATVVGNDAINRGGPSFVNRLQDLTGASAAEVVAAYVVARDGFDLPDLYRLIDGLDNAVPGDVQNGFYAQAGRLVHAATGWLVKNDAGLAAIGPRVAALKAARKVIEPILLKGLPASLAEVQQRRVAGALEAGAPEPLARRLAQAALGELVLDISAVAQSAEATLTSAANAFFGVTEAFRIGRIKEAANAIQPSDYYEGLALARASDMIDAARRGIAVAALRAEPGAPDPAAGWMEAGGERVQRARERLRVLTESGDLSVSRLTVAAGLMGDLAAGG